MKAIQELLEAYIPLKYNFTKGHECVKWAEDRLLYNEEEDDKDVILLAGSTVEEEIKELSLKILEKYLDKRFFEEEYWVGKFIVKLYESYKSGSVSIHRLDSIIWSLYPSLNYPDWLAMLSRNCEYATDMEDFRKPFEDEFLYIYELWKDASSVDEFKSKYDRQVSNSHDVVGSPMKEEDAMKLLLDLFRTEQDASKRFEWIKAVLRYPPSETIELISLLSEALDDPSPEVWKIALDGLVTISRQKAICVLEFAKERIQSRQEVEPVKIKWIDEAIQRVKKNL